MKLALPFPSLREDEEWTAKLLPWNKFPMFLCGGHSYCAETRTVASGHALEAWVP